MGVDTFGMPNALPRIAEPDEHRIQLSDVFSTMHGRHTFKFGGDVNLVHEVMINLYQGGGLYSYGESTNLLKFQDWIQDAFAGQAGDTDPYAGYHYNNVDSDRRPGEHNAGNAGQGRLLDEDVRRLCRGYLEALSRSFTVTAGVRYDIQLTPNPRSGQPSYSIRSLRNTPAQSRT